MTKLAKWHVEEILENFVLGGFPVKDDDRFLACSSILTSMIDTVEVDEPNKAFIFHTMSGSEYLCPFEDIRWTDRFAEFSKDNLERLNISRAFVDEAIKLAHEKESSFVAWLEKEIFNGDLVKYAFFLLYWTGIRLGELLALNIADIDFEKKTLSVTKSLNRTDGKDVISLPKTKSSIRIIYLPQFVVDEMKDYCGMLYGRGAKDRLFVVTKSHLEKEIKRGAELAGLTPIRVHDLRHSHASLLISQGVNVAVISRRLGHKSIKTTLNIYAHMFDKDAKEAADMLDKLYNGEED